MLVLATMSCRNGTAVEWAEVKQSKLNDADIILPACNEVAFTRNCIHAKTMYVYSDSILIVINNPTADFFLEVYNLYSGQLLGTKIRKGNGPNEMLLCDAALYGKELYINDFAKGNCAIINMEEFVSNPQTYELGAFIPYNKPQKILDIYIMPNRDTLKLNPYCFASKEDRVDNEEPRFFYNTRKISTEQLFDTYNVSQGVISINHAREHILFASRNTAYMEIYDFNLNPMIKIVGPTDVVPQYHYENRHVGFKSPAYYTYMSVVEKDNYIYAVYQGELIGSTKVSYILKYDMTGTLQKVYKLNGFMAEISATSDCNLFYVRGNDKDGCVLYEVRLVPSGTSQTEKDITRNGGNICASGVNIVCN